MADRVAQTYSNHSRFDPPYHFFILPVFAFVLIAAIVHLVRRPGLWSAAHVVLVIAAVLVVFKVRLYALKVQDRIIRLEERLRLTSLAGESLRARIGELTEPQLVALRFASDAELPALAERALSEKLSQADIKKAIQTWRPDYWRV